MQAYEYAHAAFKFGGVIFSSTFFMATGFHGFHVIIGTTFLIVCFFRRRNRRKVDAGEEEQPDHVHEMPVPGGGFEAEVAGRDEMAAIARTRQTIRKSVPMITCRPWKPVAMKKVEP